MRAFQQKEHLPVTGELDGATKARLVLVSPRAPLVQALSADPNWQKLYQDDQSVLYQSQGQSAQ